MPEEPMNSPYLRPLSVSRKHDAVIAIQQNNEAKTLEIQGLNNAAEKLLGYPHTDLQGISLYDILPPDISDDIQSFIEFDNNGKDLASVLNHMPHLSITDKEGHIVPVAHKVFYIMANSVNMPRFELLIRDQSRIELIERITKNTSKDTLLTLPNLQGTTYIGTQLTDYMQHHMLEATFASICIDNYDTLTATDRERILPIVRDRLLRVCRQDDQLTVLDNGVFGLFLLDCGTSVAQIPLNRLRSRLESSPIKLDENTSIPTTITAYYAGLEVHDNAEQVVQHCLNSLRQRDAQHVNCVFHA